MLLLSVLASMKVTELNEMLKYLARGSDYDLSLQGQTCPGPEIVLAPARTVAFYVLELQHALLMGTRICNTPLCNLNGCRMQAPLEQLAPNWLRAPSPFHHISNLPKSMAP
jgi:hypothetical protein